MLSLGTNDQCVAGHGQPALRLAQGQAHLDRIAGRQKSLDRWRLHQHLKRLGAWIAGRHDGADFCREMAPVRDDIDHVARLYRAYVTQGHEQPDLEFVGVHDSDTTPSNGAVKRERDS